MSVQHYHILATSTKSTSSVYNWEVNFSILDKYFLDMTFSLLSFYSNFLHSYAPKLLYLSTIPVLSNFPFPTISWKHSDQTSVYTSCLLTSLIRSPMIPTLLNPGVNSVFINNSQSLSPLNISPGGIQICTFPCMSLFFSVSLVVYSSLWGTGISQDPVVDLFFFFFFCQPSVPFSWVSTASPAFLLWISVKLNYLL